jgi:hypothetical protein
MILLLMWEHTCTCQLSKVLSTNIQKFPSQGQLCLETVPGIPGTVFALRSRCHPPHPSPYASIISVNSTFVKFGILTDLITNTRLLIHCTVDRT